MIGVIANPSDEGVVREFFELFKTPGSSIATTDNTTSSFAPGDNDLTVVSAKLLLVYGAERLRFDGKHKVQVAARTQGGNVSFSGTTIPLYGSVLRFARSGVSVLENSQSGEPLAYVRSAWDKCLPASGMTCFMKCGPLLIQGQPAANASFPTLDFHIAFFGN